MALKLKKEGLENLIESKSNTLGQGDITDKYSEMMFSILPEDLEVNKDKKIIEEITESSKEKIVELDLGELSNSPKNCYRELQGEKREEMIGSLKAYGQINPIIVRPKKSIEEYKELIEKEYEILVGHTRVSCLKEIQKEDKNVKTVKAIIVDCDDVQATLLIAQSNIQREKVSEIELAKAYKNTYEALKRQGERTDLTSSQFETKLRTDEIVAKKYGISRATLQRKIALAYCTDEIVDFYNKKKISQEQIQSISKLDEEVQGQIIEVMKEDKVKMSNEKSKELLRVYEEEKINPTLQNSFPLNKVRNVLRQEDDKNLDGEKKIKKENKSKFNDELFPEKFTEKEKKEYIIKALQYIRDNNIKLI